MKALKTESGLQAPLIHLNGTSYEDLFEGYAEAIRGVNDALNGLSGVILNARDYYPQGDAAWAAAKREMDARYNALTTVRDELMEILDALDEQTY